ncbi:hypothetical protein DCCM_3267 [Desulfocucumis palustris]|uniref:Uncharacterized protein n=1 Tax=Desulfocucumis palustris TaxID=1898651 RepID=A0A2L2XD54_9FIRM|nr:hypothetical protein [Desulfocucumis palustris]GBF34155.1 hypothetical protein DCCM_3267 [Desulfocucumis palustris]
MADQPIHAPKDFSQDLHLLGIEPATPELFNPLFERLINNDVFLRAFAETLAKDIFASGFVVAGMVATKNGSTPTQLDVTSGVAYLQQVSGGLARFEADANFFVVAQSSATYYLDIQPDGTYHWGTAHSAQANYLPVATVTTDGAGAIATVTDTRTIKDPNVAARVDEVAADLNTHLAEKAAQAVLGHVQVNGTTITADENGVIGVASDIAKFKSGSGTFTDNDTSQTFVDAFCTVNSLVVVTITSGTAPQGIWKVTSANGSFTITSTVAESADITFDYYIVKVV